MINPKPLPAERAFSLASVIRSYGFGNTLEAVVYRLDKLSAELGLDQERELGWTVAQTIAWSFDYKHQEYYYETAE